jgi:transcriptional regulator with XRE-family HTH domain
VSSPLGDAVTLSFEDFGKLIKNKRGGRGIRDVAEENNVGVATWSRVENGQVPDLATFAKMCKWLERDPAEFLGIEVERPEPVSDTFVHFRKKKTVTEETAMSLGALIIAIQNEARARNRLLGSV